MFGDVCMCFFFVVMGLLCMFYIALGCLHFLDLLGFIDLKEIRDRNKFHRNLKNL